MTPFQTVLTAAELAGKVRQYRKGYYATRSPNRPDHNPSILFGETESGRPWIKDLAGKETPADILKGWGLNPDTLKPETNDHIKPPRRQPGQRRRLFLNFNRPDATYNYTHADGTPSYQVRRVNFINDKGEKDKSFCQYRWEDGRYQRGRGDTPELLYNLPKVVGAEVVISCEGEKDADNLNALGYVATTHAGGAKAVDKALPAYRESLRDKLIIHLPHNDEPGRAMANTLARGLHGIAAGSLIVSSETWGEQKADVSDLIARLKAALLSNEEIKAELDRIFYHAPLWGATRPTQPAQPGPKSLAAREQILAESAQRREQKQAQKAAHEAELQRRYDAANVIPFESTEEIDPDQVEHLRAKFTNAEKWRAYCQAHWPDLDADLQYQIKLQENREARPGECGEYRKRTLPNGQVQTYRWTCGVCDQCIKKSVAIYRRALREIQGLPPEQAGDYTPLEALESDDQASKDAPHEDAPPLEKINGDLSIVRIHSHQERLHLARELRTGGILYRAIVITLEDGPAFDVIVNDDRGDPLGLVNDARIELWVRGAENKRASGKLLPSLDDLKHRYRKALPYEVVYPELDDAGQPVDPDIFALELPDIGTTAKLPAVKVDFEVNDADRLQAALFEIHREQWRILGRRGDVNLAVIRTKKFYTRYSTLPNLLDDFNAWQQALRHKKRE